MLFEKYRILVASNKGLIQFLTKTLSTINRKAAIHMVSAWACENKMVLGQIATDEKSNEITAIPKLLEMLVLDGCVITIDAMGCQKKIAEKIIDGGGSETQGDHGRIETRKVWYCQDVRWMSDCKDWPGLSSLIAVESQRVQGDKTTVERRYFISSLSNKDAKSCCQATGAEIQEANCHRMAACIRTGT